MKILITGATGFIGKAVCEALSREGHHLVAITRNPAKAQTLIPAPHQALKWDFSGPLLPSELQLIQGVDAVIHLAGEPIMGKRWNSEFQRELYNSRVNHTRNLISLLKSSCSTLPRVFISASAIGFYGNRGSETLDEASPPGTDFLARLCQDWENAIMDQPTNGTRPVALRIGIVLGRGGGALEQMIEPFSLGLGGILGDGSQWMSWIHLDDLVQIILQCLRNENLRGPINCCTPHPVANREFTADLTKRLNTTSLVPIPKLALKLALGKSAVALLSSQRVHPSRLIEANYQFKYPTLDSALEAVLGDSYAQGNSEFQNKCWIPLPIQDVFNFFSDAGNLKRITPPWLHLDIVSQSSKEIKQGTTIEYRLKLHGILMHWRTEISSWNPPHEFTDIQLKGPYHVWRHTHRFAELAGGTLMEDRVLYQVPMGYLGKLVAGKHVKKDLSKIFTYRNTKIYDLVREKTIQPL